MIVVSEHEWVRTYQRCPFQSVKEDKERGIKAKDVMAWFYVPVKINLDKSK